MPATLSKIAVISAAAAVAAIIISQRKNANQGPASNSTEISKTTGRKNNRVAVDAVFFKRLWNILKVVYPGVFSWETLYTILAAAMMIARTYCDLWMIQNTTHLERIIISRNGAEFPKGLIQFLLATFPIACVNNLLRYSLEEMSLRFRTRLSNHLFKEYLHGLTYYKINNLDNRVSNPDQLLTQDLEKVCKSVVDLYSNLSKPILDIVIYAYKLTGMIGGQGPASMLAYLVVSGSLLTFLRRPIARFTVQEQRLEGEYRFVHSRLITHSEEVAFFRGNEKEKKVIDGSFRRLVQLVRRSMQFRFGMGILDHMIGKYVATVVGFMVVSRPFLDPTNTRLATFTHAELMEEYYRSGRMLINLATAVGRLVLAGRELTRLAGFISRMTEFIEVLSDLKQGKYTRTMVNNEANNATEALELVPNSGKIVEVDYLIKFDNVPVVTPNGDVLIRNLNFEVKAGMNVLVAGPNGCGKSSLFRILGELWPLFGGTLYKPRKDKLFYVPQRPYMTLGTLREQVIYPDSLEDCRRKGITDEQLSEMLGYVQLSYLADRDQGWDAIQDWMDVLSGGEKQRIAMARLFYHKPQFAILDECTSATSVDVEGAIYTHCRKLGITLFTVSHRKSLWQYHEYVLRFDGQGAYEFKPIDTETNQFGS
eukprot:TRINITY_DN1643_c0_g2_i1.p1 TRINITY_DN1643_c0_g2~~TRINITY_DN1643_c0_g2_i1.p1  ORF type:complete len:651 (-),score=146.99 TRINITY_DN1643_c0_g2_i1:256-2208(-)